MLNIPRQDHTKSSATDEGAVGSSNQDSIRTKIECRLHISCNYQSAGGHKTVRLGRYIIKSDDNPLIDVLKDKDFLPTVINWIKLRGHNPDSISEIIIASGSRNRKDAIVTYSLAKLISSEG